MKKKNLLAASASIAALATMLVVPAVADETETGTVVEGTNSVITAEIDVTLPAELPFGINPLKLDADGDTETTPNDNVQIIASDFLFYNNGQTPVIVTTETKAAKTENSTGKATITNAAVYNEASGEMEVSMDAAELFLLQAFPERMYVSGDLETVTTESAAVTNLLSITNEATAVTNGACVVSTGANKVYYALDKLSSSGLYEVKNVGSFSFTGAVDPQATFEEGEFTVSTVFNLDIISDAQYEKNWEKTSEYGHVYDNIRTITNAVLTIN